MSRRKAPSTGGKRQCMTIDLSLLTSDEKLIWSGKPGPLRYALGEAFLTFVLGAFFFLMSLIWVYVAMLVGGYLWLLGFPLVAVGAALLATPLYAFYRARCTTYLLTNKRAIVAVSGIAPHQFSVPLSAIDTIDARPYSDDHGAIILKEVVTKDPETGGETIEHEGFIAIPDLAGVVRILRQAIDKLPDDRTSQIAS
jgi:hypothetical protein